MKKIICKREYDTETATLVKKHTVGEFGDPAGYEETLYQTPAACTSSISVAALHLPMPRRTSSAWPRARWTPGSNPTECAVCCTKASGSGNGSAFGGVSTLWAFALGKGDASYA